MSLHHAEPREGRVYVATLILPHYQTIGTPEKVGMTDVASSCLHPLQQTHMGYLDPEPGWWLLPRGHLMHFHFGRRRIGQDGALYKYLFLPT